MTIPAGSIKHVYDGNATTRDWDFTFPIITTDGSDIKLYLTAIDGTVTEITSNYSVDVAGSFVTYPTIVSGLALLAVGEKITLVRTEALSQAADWKNKGPFNSETVEAALDKLTAIIQQQQEELSRAIKYGVDQTPTAVDTESFIAILTALKVAAETARDIAIAAKNSADADVILTHADVVLTHADVVLTHADAAQTALDGIATAADRVQTGLDKTATGLDKVATNADVVLTHADVVLTHADVVLTHADVLLTHADAAQTALDRIATAADRVQTGLDVIAAQNYAAALKGTSTSSIAIGTGSKTFVTQASKQFAAGQFILITSDANSANYMHGQVTSYSTTSLVVNVIDVGGSGTLADWTISVSGSRGAIGETGAEGANDKVKNVSADASAGYLAEKLAALYPSLYQRDQKWALKTPYSTAANRYIILTPAKLSVDINGTVYFLTAQAEIALSLEANWDTIAGTDYRTAANRAGKDFYIYACVPVSGSAPKIVLSANSTTPSGYSASTSRKIGGFHGLCVAVGTISGHTLTDFVAGDVLPASIWDLNFKPKFANPEGMVYSDGINKWVDIYLASGTGASTASVYGATISDTRNWMDFADDGGAVKKKMLDDAEFQVIAAGSNEETNITGSSDPGTTGGHVDTAARRMISNIGVEDACGVLQQWLSTQGYMYTGTTGYWGNLPGGKGSSYNNFAADPGAPEVDNSDNGSDRKLVAGGDWGNAAAAGSRSRNASNYRWLSLTSIGCRFCAEPV